jgi:hypothetical protein
VSRTNMDIHMDEALHCVFATYRRRNRIDDEGGIYAIRKGVDLRKKMSFRIEAQSIARDMTALERRSPQKPRCWSRPAL